ncbi:hypothetical protein [Rhodospirillum sp. A1_3_36]|uniref:hypothetical protein n=1 Tax=Rhodospirillum sp. A1_3_36 TaxID=3391666 RepID=UPI0039A48FC3
MKETCRDGHRSEEKPMKDPLAISPREPPCGRAWRERDFRSRNGFRLRYPCRIGRILERPVLSPMPVR